jgi:small subunit ribosomal protein S7e
MWSLLPRGEFCRSQLEKTIEKNKSKQKHPRILALTAVHDGILEDLVFPSETGGKKIRVKLDGSWLIKVHLDKAQQNNVEHKVETFSGVFKKLTARMLILNSQSFSCKQNN